MRKIKVIITYNENDIQSEIDNWTNSNKTKGYHIISVNGYKVLDGNVTYILYETKPEGVLLS